jgi:hypothetical protein
LSLQNLNAAGLLVKSEEGEGRSDAEEAVTVIEQLGSKTARVFIKGREARELGPSDSLVFLRADPKNI